MSAIIFDFDGTIADSFEVIVGIFYEVTKREVRLDDAEIERLRGMSLVQAAEELRIPAWKMPFLIYRGRRRMSKLMSHIAVHRGIPETIRKLQAEGHQLFIVSSNSEKNIRIFLDKHHMTNEFVNIYGSVGLLGKARILKKVIRKNNLDPHDTWYVGDEVRDIVGAFHADLPIISASWGFNTAEILAAHNPTALVSTPNNIITVLEETN